MARSDTRAIGGAAEQFAWRYLQDRGLIPVERNYRCRLGEVDLIMLDQNCLVFVEVRYRSHGALASAIATVDRRKQQKLIRTAEMFLATRPRHSSCIARFDVVAIDSLGNGSTTIDWIRDAFRP